jgi:hypothetical protein
LFFNSDLPTGVFRIDHDQKFEQTRRCNTSSSAGRGFFLT